MQGRFISQVKDLGIEYKLNTMVMDISHEKVVTAMNREDGLFEIQAKAVILAMGCRGETERRVKYSGIPPGGIYPGRNGTASGKHRRLYAGT